MPAKIHGRLGASALAATTDTTVYTVPASRKALERAGWKAADLDLLEINEAFAAPALQMCWGSSKLGMTIRRTCGT
jgi:acetyl-CoA C-acetyltransferase